MLFSIHDPTLSEESSDTMTTAGPRVLRFDRTGRVVHWTQAVTFLVLLATGLAISISGLEAIFGHRAFLREVHLAAAFFFVFGPAIVAIAGNRAGIREDMRSVDEWSRDDIRWMTHPTVQPNDYTPPAGRYNAGQKLNAIFTAYSTLAFAATGLIIWQNRRFPFSLVAQANSVHMYLAYFAMAIFLGHLYLSAVHPATRKALGGIIFGAVDREWAHDHHPKWRLRSAPESPLTTKNVVRAMLLTALGFEGALLATRFGFEWLGANVTDPVTKMIYRFSGLPATVQHSSTGVHSFDLAALVWLGTVVAIGYGIARSRPLLPRTLLQPLEG